jgi:hypothetical protein
MKDSVKSLTARDSIFAAAVVEMSLALPCSQLGCGRSISDLRQNNPSRVLSVEGAMIDALVNVAIFATLGLCIVGFGAWAQKRVP